MWLILKGILGKYLFEIIATVLIGAAIGVIWWNAQTWCNRACRESKQELLVAQGDLIEAQDLVKLCEDFRAKDKETYLKQRELWQAEVIRQKEEIVQATKDKQRIVDRSRQSFDKIFKENKKNAETTQQRIVAEVRPSDTITVPLALVREYNKAVAVSASIAEGNSGDQSSVAQDSGNLVGQTGTFDALAVAKILIGNVESYNELALRTSALVELVKELEARYGRTDTTGVDVSSSVNGGDSSSRTP